MLEEAVEIIRALWTGETIEHRGAYYEVENAKVFDPPQEPPPIIVSGFGTKPVELAARIGHGYSGHSPAQTLLVTFSPNGCSGPRYSQMKVSSGPYEADARKNRPHLWPHSDPND